MQTNTTLEAQGWQEEMTAVFSVRLHQENTTLLFLPLVHIKGRQIPRGTARRKRQKRLGWKTGCYLYLQGIAKKSVGTYTVFSVACRCSAKSKSTEKGYN